MHVLASPEAESRPSIGSLLKPFQGSKAKGSGGNLEPD